MRTQKARETDSAVARSGAPINEYARLSDAVLAGRFLAKRAEVEKAEAERKAMADELGRRMAAGGQIAASFDGEAYEVYRLDVERVTYDRDKIVQELGPKRALALMSPDNSLLASAAKLGQITARQVAAFVASRAVQTQVRVRDRKPPKGVQR